MTTDTIAVIVGEMREWEGVDYGAPWTAVKAWADRLDALDVEKDAARWRYIRNDGLIWRATFLVSDPTNTEVYSGEKADAVVDAAIAKVSTPKPVEQIFDPSC